MSEEYDNQKTERSIGQLYPVLVDKKGNVIDGFHRLEQNPEWRKEKLEQIDNEEKLLVARAVANWNRRQVSREEKEEWVNRLARIYKKQGLKVYGKGRGQQNEVISKIVEITGISQTIIESLIMEEYKQRDSRITIRKPRMEASKRIENVLGTNYVERHRQEVIDEETPKIREEIKKELLKSPTFQREVIKEIQKPRITHPSEACPSGICELPPTIEAGEPVDVIAEGLTIFWENNPNCQCKTCEHYMKCGVIR